MEVIISFKDGLTWRIPRVEGGLEDLFTYLSNGENGSTELIMNSANQGTITRTYSDIKKVEITML